MANLKAARGQQLSVALLLVHLLSMDAACCPIAIQAPMSPSSTQPSQTGSAVDALLARLRILQTSTAAKLTDHVAKGCTFLLLALQLQTGRATCAPTGPTKTHQPIKTPRAPSNRNVVPVNSMLTLAKRQPQSAKRALPASTKTKALTETLALRMPNATGMPTNTLRYKLHRLQTGFAALLQNAQNISTRHSHTHRRRNDNAARERRAH